MNQTRKTKVDALNYTQPRISALRERGYKVLIHHYRIYAKVTNGSLHYTKRAGWELEDIDTKNIQPKGGMTVVELYSPHGKALETGKYCYNAKQTYCKYVGIQRALKSVERKLKNNPQRKQEYRIMVNTELTKAENPADDVELQLADELQELCKKLPVQDMPALVNSIMRENGLSKEQACRKLFLDFSALMHVVGRLTGANNQTNQTAIGGQSGVGAELEVIKGGQ